MLRRVYFIAKKEIIQLLRDRRTFGALLIAPIIQLIVFGYVATTEIRKSPMVICDRSRSPESRELVNRFVSSGYFIVEKYVDNLAGFDHYLDSGEAIIAIAIPPEFAREISRGSKAEIGIYIDGTNSNLATILMGYAQMIVRGYSTELVNNFFLDKGLEPPQLSRTEPRVWFNPELKSANFMVPGVMAMLTLMLLLNMTTLGVVREKELGTAEQLAVTPIKPFDLILGKLIPPMIIGYLIITLVLVVGLAWFGITFVGSIPLLYFLSFFFILACLTAGLFLSTFANTGDQAVWMNQVFAIPNILLSGFIFPISNMPKAIQVVTYFLPMRYYLKIIRGLFLRGAGFSQLWDEALILFVWSVLIITLASMRLKKRFV